MKAAKVLVRVIQLACPHCQQVMTDSKQQAVSIHADRAFLWEQMQARSLTCGTCNQMFKLPVNPFPDKQEGE